MAQVASAMVCAMQVKVAACIAIGELVVDEPIVSAWVRAAGDSFLRSMAVVIVATDNAIDATVDVSVDTDLDKLIDLCCMVFDCCFAKVMQMSCLPSFTASSATNASQYLQR